MEQYITALATWQAVVITIATFYIVQMLKAFGLKGKWILPIVILVGMIMGIIIAMIYKTDLLKGAFTGVYAGGFATYLKNILTSYFPNLKMEDK